MRLTIAALLAAMAVAAIATTAQAQTPMNSAGNIGQRAGANSGKDGTDTTIKAKANDKAYNAALKNLPDRQYDPWHGVR
jgi:hypothetical protein